MHKLIKTKHHSTGNHVKAYLEDSDGDVTVLTIECGIDHYDDEMTLEENVMSALIITLAGSNGVQLDEDCMEKLHDAVRIPMSCHES